MVPDTINAVQPARSVAACVVRVKVKVQSIGCFEKFPEYGVSKKCHRDVVEYRCMTSTVKNAKLLYGFHSFDLFHQVLQSRASSSTRAERHQKTVRVLRGLFKQF